MRRYVINFIDFESDYPKSEVVKAKNAKEAYTTFMDNHNWTTYSAWVDSYINSKGEIYYFNNFSGKPY